MKKCICLIAVVAISALIFWSGYSLGYSSKEKNTMIADHIATEQLIAASQNLILLEMISEGKIQKVINELNSRLDSQITVANKILPEGKEFQGRQIANTIFLRAAKYRNKFPREKIKENSPNEIDQYLIQLLKASGKPKATEKDSQQNESTIPSKAEPGAASDVR